MTINLCTLFEREVPKMSNIRLRDRRAFYASSTGKDPREEYWSFMGEPETNPTDFYGSLRMLIGTAIGKEIGSAWLRTIHNYSNITLVGAEVPVGGSKPAWDGYIDYLFQDNETKEYLICELKTTWGFGADLLAKEPHKIEHANYFLQLGLYLKDFYDKGLPAKGSLFFILLSDKNFGKRVQYNCVYNPERCSVVCNSFCTSDSDKEFPIKLEYSISEVFEDWKSIIQAVKNEVLPAGKFRYKYEITPELLESLSDYKLKKIIEEGVILGDWQVSYSRYKNKIIALEGSSREYTDEEMQLFVSEYKKRHPRSKIEPIRG